MMRYLKLASDKNPDTDFIELNDFNGFLCTSFQTLGISRKLDFLAVNNRQFTVENKPEFKKYSLTIDILTNYAAYEEKHRDLVTFLDRNKKSGLRLYYRPYDGMELRYCLCDIESSQKTEKRQPVVLTLAQNSLWLGEEKRISTSAEEQGGNMFVFGYDEDITGYYAAAFKLDEEVLDYYCVSFYNGAAATAIIVNNSYNEIPLNFKIHAPCVNPLISLYKQGETSPIRQVKITASLEVGFIEINANIGENCVLYKNTETGVVQDYTELVNNEFGSPYFYIDNGEYYIKVTDENNNVCYCDTFYQEEYSE